MESTLQRRPGGSITLRPLGLNRAVSGTSLVLEPRSAGAAKSRFVTRPTSVLSSSSSTISFVGRIRRSKVARGKPTPFVRPSTADSAPQVAITEPAAAGDEGNLKPSESQKRLVRIVILDKSHEEELSEQRKARTASCMDG
ncbi:Aste57867_14582 [Aphanomyces stellatus]|uniref:Aste57867_14582 protein n=1 Tax=Aphanomyces stellatus TaxID=120398 RepID=A0A485L2Q1_9STRA|nr:hypothetical protein As57867_014528 [Aphanomyces stellatus]VFT91401.1 Aste57867_14582 [Aphanomyces stellatus]